MIYLTAIPDDYYFTWQLEIQLYNFNSLGVDPNIIHVLIAYDAKRGLGHYFTELLEKLKDRANFFVYPDDRKQKLYPSSIRPNLIVQHIKAYPKLEKEVIFYYDTDVIFRELPHFEQMLEDSDWHVSDTRNYLDSNYVKKNGSEELFNTMCNYVGINPEIVIANDINCGGAQYLIKNAALQFWEKVEKDCEALFDIMESHNCALADTVACEGNLKSEYIEIQAWCADMWAVLWNAWLFGKTVKINPELDFCWPSNHIQEWYNKKILHYSGNVPKEYNHLFRKGKYVKYSPYYDQDLKKIRIDSCSYPLAELINTYRVKLDKERIELNDMTFLVPIRIDSESRLENIYYTVWYLDKYFKTNIIIAESDSEIKIDHSLLPSTCSYNFLYNDNPSFHRTKINNWLISNAKTPFIALYDADTIIPVKQIVEAIELLRNNTCQMAFPYDGSFTSVDSLFKEIFGKILDDTLFTLNVDKFPVAAKRSYGGVVFINKKEYVNAGMDNEHFTHWGPDDIERSKRMKNLEHIVKRINGPLFHLPHSRLENSFYKDISQRIEFMEEYFKICNMKDVALKAYIQTWPWFNK